MPMMDVRRVCMTVRERRVGVLVRVCLAAWLIGTMRVLVVFVVHMPMGVRQRLMDMVVLVPLRQM